jgi:hypothetical protein
MEEELERFEDQALSNLDNENMSKLIDSLSMLIGNINQKEYNYLVYENLIELNENLNKVQYGYYPGFQSLLAKTLSLLEEVSSKCDNANLKPLINESIANINRLFTDYGYDYNPKSYTPNYQNKYPKYNYKKNPYQPSKAPKQLVDEIVKSLTHRDPRVETTPLLSDIANEIALVHAGKIEQPKEELEDLDVTKLFNDALNKLKHDKEEYQNKIKLSKELKNEKLELANSKEELDSWRKKMLSKCINQLIVEFGD